MKRSPTQRKFFVYLKALAALGPRWALGRLRLALLIKTGVIERRTPSQSWDCVLLADLLRPGIPVEPCKFSEWRRRSAPKFLFDALVPKDVLDRLGNESIESADRIL